MNFDTDKAIHIVMCTLAADLALLVGNIGVLLSRYTYLMLTGQAPLPTIK